MPMKITTINVPDAYLECIESFVKEGLYISRSDFARIAIDRFLLKEAQTNQKLHHYLEDV